jgi:hypothetical protein
VDDEDEGVRAHSASAVDAELKRRIVDAYYMREVRLVDGEETAARPVLRAADDKKNVRYRDSVRATGGRVARPTGMGKRSHALLR